MLKKYKTERGLYLGLEDLPGPYTDSLLKLGEMINDIERVSGEYHLRYEVVKKWSTFSVSKDISKEITDVIFGKNDS